MDLFCFPYAGAGASIYRQWQRAAGGDRRFRIVPIQLPGRENRLNEQPYRRMADLVDDFIYAMVPMISKPFAFFGHSMGALTAYEVACALRDRGMPQPARLLLSAFRAPHLPSANIKIYHLPDEVLKIVLAKDGISPDVLASEELMRALLPTLRADLELCDTYEHVPRQPLDVPISAYGGEQDIRVHPEDLAGWCEHTTSTFDLTTYPGDHFYLQPAMDELVKDVRLRLSSSFHTQTPIHGGDVA
ncbi:thioesterase II family protein [Naumannella halotolerans]|nr:alpha/beta fold hydrolase [Naumannella halotolerans]